MSRQKSFCGCAMFIAAAAVCFAFGQETSAPKSPGVNAGGVIIGDFDKQVKDYVKLHKKAEAGLPAQKPTDSAHILNERRRLLASRIQTARRRQSKAICFRRRSVSYTNV